MDVHASGSPSGAVSINPNGAAAQPGTKPVSPAIAGGAGSPAAPPPAAKAKTAVQRPGGLTKGRLNGENVFFGAKKGTIAGDRIKVAGSEQLLTIQEFASGDPKGRAPIKVLLLLSFFSPSLLLCFPPSLFPSCLPSTNTTNTTRAPI